MTRTIQECLYFQISFMLFSSHSCFIQIEHILLIRIDRLVGSLAHSFALYSFPHVLSIFMKPFILPSFSHRFIGSMNFSLVRSLLIPSINPLFVCSFIQTESFIFHSIIHSPTYMLLQLFVNSLNPSFLLPKSLAHSFIRSLNHTSIAQTIILSIISILEFILCSVLVNFIV